TVYRHTPASWLRRAGYGSGEYAPAHASRKGPARVHERTHIPGTPAGRTPAPHSRGASTLAGTSRVVMASCTRGFPQRGEAVERDGSGAERPAPRRWGRMPAYAVGARQSSSPK